MCPAYIFLATVIVLWILYEIYRRDKFSINNNIAIKSSVDGQVYKVHALHKEDSLSAADLLANINMRNITLCRHLKNKYIKNERITNGSEQRHGYSKERIDATQRLLKNYNPDNIFENSPRDISGDTSYTINKGKTLALCLRERDPTKSGRRDKYDLHDLNTLMFVDLHELSHIAAVVEDHPKEFWSTFKFVLEEAVQIGIYEAIDYSRHPAYYCGIDIVSNPLFDPSVESI
jgi:hypothetical protein